MSEDTPKKEWRAIKPDAQGFDRIEIVTEPRYKESGLSGDEWRISAQVIFYRKGIEIHRTQFRNVETACGFLYAEHAKALDAGMGLYAGERGICDQEGCSEPATWKHTLKKGFSRDGSERELRHDGEYRLFCGLHKTRGDCGLEDADRNYDVTPLISAKAQGRA